MLLVVYRKSIIFSILTLHPKHLPHSVISTKNFMGGRFLRIFYIANHAMKIHIFAFPILIFYVAGIFNTVLIRSDKVQYIALLPVLGGKH